MDQGTERQEEQQGGTREGLSCCSGHEWNDDDGGSHFAPTMSSDLQLQL